MVIRELIRIGACALVGMIIGIYFSVHNSYWQYSLLGMGYAIGIFYGIRLILIALAGLGKTAGKTAFYSIARGNWFGLLIILVLLFLGIGFVLSFGWILGIFAAGKALFDAFKTDSEIGGNSNNRYDNGWNSGGTWSSGKTKKSKRKSTDDYDHMSW